MTMRTRRLFRTHLASGSLFVAMLAAQPAVFESPARAQSGAEDPTTAMARARFKEGVEYYDKGQYEAARADFLQAYALKKHPSILLNLAWSCLKSGHALEAERYFKQFLSEGKEITDKQRADANDGLTQSHAKLGRIEIAAPTGTEVTIDGERAGTTPISDLIAVEAGAHTVKFKAPDGSIETESVSVMGGEKVVARFARAAVATAMPPPSAAPSAESAPPLPPVSKSSEEPPSPEAPPAKKERVVREEHGSGPGLFSAPDHTWPSILMWSAGVAAAGGAVAAGIIKNTAQDNANQTATNIVNSVGPAMAAGACDMPQPGSRLATACSEFATDNNDVNVDATLGNVLVGAAVGLTVGGFLWWFLAPKERTGEASAADTPPQPKPVVTPVVGRGFGGLTVGGQF